MAVRPHARTGERLDSDLQAASGELVEPGRRRVQIQRRVGAELSRADASTAEGVRCAHTCRHVPHSPGRGRLWGGHLRGHRCCRLWDEARSKSAAARRRARSVRRAFLTSCRLPCG